MVSRRYRRLPWVDAFDMVELSDLVDDRIGGYDILQLISKQVELYQRDVM